MNWFQVRERLSEHYKCRRCDNTVCTRVPVQIMNRELLELKDKLLEKRRDKLIIEHNGILYLHPPCPFYGVCEDGEQGCTIHMNRPILCRPFPFGEIPSILGLDFCPMAQEIEQDMQKVIGNLKSEYDEEFNKRVSLFREKKEQELEIFGEETMMVKYYPLANFILLLEQKQGSG